MVEKVIDNPERFDAEDFVRRLLDEGEKCPCDETAQAFNKNVHLPHFYDQLLFKRGQKFFYDNIFAMLYGKFLGLLTILAVPSIRRVLQYTKMSGCPLTAYRRYLSTVFHMWIWYHDDFTPESKLWTSLAEVKSKHNSASKRCSTTGKRITQKDMALTQFGFMGYALAKKEEIGLFNVDNKDWKAFVHVWRVIGFIMGIEDRFNICRDSVEETTKICQVLGEKVFKPAMEKKDKDFLAMAKYLSEGMWAMNPTLNVKIYLNLAYRLLQTFENNNLEEEKLLLQLNFVQNLTYQFLIIVIWTLQFTVFKIYHNYTQYISMWLMRVFPFLAYYKFGYANSHVYVLEKSTKTR